MAHLLLRHSLEVDLLEVYFLNQQLSYYVHLHQNPH
jgi:hypothetical protein